MRRYRRLVMIDRLIPFLAAFVGLIALAGSVVVQMQGEARTRAVGEELVAMRAGLEQLTARTEALAIPVDDGTAAGLLALQDRMVRIEAEFAAIRTAATSPAAPAAPDEAGAATATVEVDPDLPTADCIPLGTRFMVTPGETVPICQSRARVKVGGITADSVDIEGAGPIVETGFGTLIGTTCTVMVFSADIEGFAELRVTCT
ncbi:hypothetical protein [Devosia sp.]|uniref:hypothetical protein n=1 Tax=Devosia sp. TaxID=1871048 RepID=UPI0035B3A3B5